MSDVWTISAPSPTQARLAVEAFCVGYSVDTLSHVVVARGCCLLEVASNFYTVNIWMTGNRKHAFGRKDVFSAVKLQSSMAPLGQRGIHDRNSDSLEHGLLQYGRIAARVTFGVCGGLQYKHASGKACRHSP